LRDDLQVDFRATARRARDVIAGRPGEVGAGDIALLRDSRDLLPDWYEDWATVEREQFRELRLEALERICRSLSRAARYADAVQAGLAAVAGEPNRESAHHALIAAHLAEGNRADALRQYELMCGLLRRNLDLEPSSAVQELLGAPA
jgi:DNA-binding SARP family transcriptional activator